ncbi:MAG: hypothetical protein E7641_07590 [Ruminococcaceae bacterium]|nr:hypothetical protein [Oscillospiraceae bacterium]
MTNILWYDINPTVLPATFDVKDLIYVSEDPEVATVSEGGAVSPISKGETRIFVYAPDYKCHAVMTLKVVDKVKLEGITIPVSNATVKVGDTLTLQATLTPANTTEHLLSFTSSDTTVLTVDDFGKVTAVGTGTATVTVTGANGVKATYTAKVIEPVESISFNDNFYVTFVGDTNEDWMPTVLPEDASEYTLTWASSNPEIAYVDDNGKLVRVACGSATLRATITGTDLYDELNVSVSDVENFTNAKVIEMDYNGDYVYAVTDDTALWAWGGGEYRLPMKITDGVKDVICYSSSVYVLKIDGTVEYGYLSVSGQYISSNGSQYQMAVADLNNVVALEQDDGSCYALRADGTVWAWGYNAYGQLGDGTTAYTNIAVQMGVANVKKVVTFNWAVLLLTNDGKAYCYGTYNNKYTEAELIRENVIDIRGGYHATLELNDGRQFSVYATGRVEEITNIDAKGHSFDGELDNSCNECDYVKQHDVSVTTEASQTTATTETTSNGGCSSSLLDGYEVILIIMLVLVGFVVKKKVK